MKYSKTTQYKYRLRDGVGVNLGGDFPDLVCRDRNNPLVEYFRLADGYLWIRDGYAWDGASGPTLDTPATMLASLVHDALYQAIRERLLPVERRGDADAELYRLMRQRGMRDATRSRRPACFRVWAEIRALYFFLGVRTFGFLAARPRRGKREQQEIVYEV